MQNLPWPKANLTALLSESRMGTQRPIIEVQIERGLHHRQLNAILHSLAASAELATALNERWVVGTEVLSNGHGIVYLELADGTSTEARQGLELLNRVVERWQAGR